MSRPISLRRTAILLALLALLLAATVVGALLNGLFRSSATAVVLRPAGECAKETGPCPYTLSGIFADGHEQTIFPPPDAGPVEFTGLALSPDGKQLIVVAASYSQGVGWSDLPWEVWALRTDGSDPHRLRSADQGWCGSPAWSPDGRTIACFSEDRPFFRSDEIPERRALLAIDVASGASTELVVSDDYTLTEGTPLEEPPYSAYRWSPNGEWLGYVTYENAADGSSHKALWVVRRDGSERRQLASGQVCCRPGRPGDSELLMSDLSDFRWSPASDAIAYGDRPYPREAINVVRLDGTRAIITLPDEEGIGVVYMVAWDQPDRLTYRSTDWKFVATTALDGTRGEVLIDVRGTEPPWSDDPMDPWLVADGQSLSWWEKGESQMCLMETADGRSARSGMCIDGAYPPTVAGQVSVSAD